jgi:hypothetical protein
LPPGPIPANSTKVAYGKIQMTNVSRQKIFLLYRYLRFSQKKILKKVGFLPELIIKASVRVDSQYPLSFEQLGQVCYKIHKN